MIGIKSTHGKVNDKCIMPTGVYQIVTAFSFSNNLSYSLCLKNNCLLYCFIIIYEAPIFPLLPFLNDTFTRLTGTRKKWSEDGFLKQPPNTFNIFIAFRPFYIWSVAKMVKGGQKGRQIKKEAIKALQWQLIK